MLSKSQIPASGHQPGFSLEEVHETSLGKSFDYRLLNLVLYALRCQPPDPLLLEFLRVDEHLVDIGDDLVDYEGDVVKNSFNIFRAYVHLYGRAAPLKLAERISEYEARHVQLLVGLPQQLQQHFRRRQHEAAGSDAALRWSFPQPIFDEGRFREEHAGDSSSDESSQ
ncbi:hypothetical protein N2152v2_007444 [Parachlorella kessleri]